MTCAHAALLAAAAVCVWVVGAAPAHASCAQPIEPVRLADHELVFAGEVVDTDDGGRLAEVRVLDVWHGRALPPEVVVLGGVGDGMSSVDRSFVKGETYAFFTYEDEDGVLRDSSCTPTAPLSQRVALDPPGARPPDAEARATTDPRTPPWMWLAGGAAAVATGVASVALRRSRAGQQ